MSGGAAEKPRIPLGWNVYGGPSFFFVLCGVCGFSDTPSEVLLSVCLLHGTVDFPAVDYDLHALSFGIAFEVVQKHLARNLNFVIFTNFHSHG
jgi:hypothetical protein